MKTINLIEEAEKKYLALLGSFFKGKWGETKLWSHDLDHHRRVWEYAKELLQYTDSPDQLFIEKLLIASYLHDIGMVHDQGERHGVQSRKFCEEFLEENKINPADYADLLEAIENHDNKEYKEDQQDNRLLLCLTVADDLDAFDEAGIERYREIYLARGIKPENIGRLIIENSAKRFTNFEKTFSAFPELIDKHRRRYNILNSFYSASDKQK
jgi:HD superfamily phosphodiesterase